MMMLGLMARMMPISASAALFEDMILVPMAK
jgi:hypothetical protein